MHELDASYLSMTKGKVYPFQIAAISRAKENKALRFVIPIVRRNLQQFKKLRWHLTNTCGADGSLNFNH